MAELASDFANAKKALVVAPAGCGKTHLITAAVKQCKGRQLVLTHTHAGVRALRDRMDQLQVPPTAYHITTLDSFSLRFASAYPSVSGWTVNEPEQAQWTELRPAVLKVVQLQAIADVLQATYTGVFVDEYQDCGYQQHALISRLSEILPCRIVGDPLQAVFAGMNISNKEPLCWDIVEKEFEQFPQLNIPHRWKGKNEKLGQWLLDIRDPLLKNEPIDLRGVACVTHKLITRANARTEQRDICYALAKHRYESVIGIRDLRKRCHDLSGQLNNIYSVFEDAEGRDILSSARAIEKGTGIHRVNALVNAAQSWLTLSSHNLDSLVLSVSKNKPPAVKDPGLAAIHPLLVAVRDQNDLRAVIPAMKAISELPNAKFRSQEVWHGLMEGISAAAVSPGLSVRDAIWKRRDLMRRMGRHPPQRCLSTPLLVKGLQCDHAVVFDAAELPKAEWIYVALTRASRTLTILGASTVICAERTA